MNAFKKRLGRASILILCIMRWVIYGSADKVPQNISRIIVVPVGKLGDVICTTQVFYAIRTHLPEAKIIVAGNPKLHKPLLSDSDLVDEYLDLNEDDVLARIKECRADVAILTDPTFELTALLYLAGVPIVIAPEAIGSKRLSEVTRPYKILLKFIKSFPYKFGGYAPLERLKALEPLGIKTTDTRKHLGFSEDAGKKADDLISQIPHAYKYLVGISAGAGNKEKQWDPKKFSQVANYLISNHQAHVFVFGGKNDVLESNEMISAITDKSRVTDTTHISIDDLKATISKMDLFISVNTGPIYIAEAFGISTVDLVGPVSAWDQPPQGKIHKVVFPPGKPAPLLCIMNSRNHDVKEAERIAKSTRLDDVILAVEEALKEVDKVKSVNLE